ncbi:MAG: hypothetical protein COC15_04440, partial [Legionellales bacterium]
AIDNNANIHTKYPKIQHYKTNCDDKFNQQGNTALIIAASLGKVEVVNVLIERAKQLDRESKSADSKDLVNLVNQQNTLHGNTALHMVALEVAMSDRHEEIMKILLHNGARNNIKNLKGKTVEVLLQSASTSNSKKYLAITKEKAATLPLENKTSHTISTNKVIVQTAVTFINSTAKTSNNSTNIQEDVAHA